MDIVRTVHFHGYLKKLVPEPVRFAGHTVMEVMNGVSKLVPAFRDRSKQYRVQIKGYETVERLNARTDETDIHVFPAFVVSGGRTAAIGQIILGAILITAGIVVGMGTAGFGSPWAVSLIMTGSSMVLGGLIGLLTPAPQMAEKGSKYIGAGRNTVTSGTPIPLLFGRDRGYGHYISFDVDTKDVWRGGAPSGGAGGSSTFTDYAGAGHVTSQDIRYV